MNEHSKITIRREIVNYMFLVATRNRTEIENKASAFILSLEGHTDPELQGLSHFVKGITFFFHNNYAEAEKHFKEILELPTKKITLQGIAHMGLGFTHRSTGRLDEAVTCLFAATEEIDRSGVFKPFLQYCYQQLGEIHVAIHEYDNAIGYFNNAMTVSGADQTSMSVFRFHMGLGGCYLEMKKYEKAESHLAQALAVKGLPLPIVSRVENDLGVLFLEVKKYGPAEELLAKSLATREANGLEDAACTTMTALAEVYLEQNKVDEALQLLNRCMTIVEKYKTKRKKIEVLKLMARAHGNARNYELAVSYYEQYMVLFAEVQSEQERNIFKFKNEQIEKQKKIISDKHQQLTATFEEVKRLKVNRRAIIFSWITIVILVVISELFIDPLIENHAYNNLLSLLIKVLIALLFKPLDGLYEKILWDRTLRKAE